MANLDRLSICSSCFIVKVAEEACICIFFCANTTILIVFTWMDTMNLLFLLFDLGLGFFFLVYLFCFTGVQGILMTLVCPVSQQVQLCIN